MPVRTRKYGRVERESILSDLNEWANLPENKEADDVEDFGIDDVSFMMR